MLTPCNQCPCWFDCKKYGCYAWDDDARKTIEAKKEATSNG
jgi:hypothetical protein